MSQASASGSTDINQIFQVIEDSDRRVRVLYEESEEARLLREKREQHSLAFTNSSIYFNHRRRGNTQEEELR